MQQPSGGEKSRMRRLLSFDWDAIAGILAAVAAIVMHFLHLIDQGVLLMITVVLLALLFLRALRREPANERMERSLERTETVVTDIRSALNPPDAVLVGPRELLSCSQRFAGQAQGDMVWFHVCLLMFKPQALFDALLRPAVENPMVRSVQFVLDRSQQPLWESEVLPKLQECRGYRKVRPPAWTDIDENVSFILAETAPGQKTEALLSFWGEPFMSRSTGGDIPRYIFHVQGHSELVARLVEVERRYRLGS